MKRSFKRCNSKYQIIFLKGVVMTQETNIGRDNLVIFLSSFLVLAVHFIFFFFSSFLPAYLPTLVPGLLFILPDVTYHENGNLFLPVDLPIIAHIVFDKMLF